MNYAKILSDAKRDPYEFFGSDVDAVYRKHAAALHPDRGGDKALFQLLGELRSAIDTPAEVVNGYSLRSAIARGDLCDVHYAVKDGASYVLKRPYVEVPAALNIMAKERECLEQIHEKAGCDTYHHYFPKPHDSFVTGKKRINAFPWREVHSASDIMRRHGSLDGRHVAWMFKRVLTCLGFAHNSGWCHNAVTPDHLLFSVGDHGLVLCDWIHATKPGSTITIVPSKYKDWYPTDSKQSSPGIDIYMAAKCMLMIGGDGLHQLIKQFMNGCLLPSASMRPNDAWDVHDQFVDLLDQLYGPPRFVPLEM